MTGAGFIFQAVTDAAAALTLAVTDLPSNAPFDAVQPQLDALARAVSRANITMAMHPELNIGQALPRYAMTQDDRDDQYMSVAALSIAASMPSEPVRITLYCEPRNDGSREDELRSHFHMRSAVADPANFGYKVDLGLLISRAAQDLLPEPEEFFLQDDDVEDDIEDDDLLTHDGEALCCAPRPRPLTEDD